MQSAAANVDLYLAGVPENRRAVLAAVRDACDELLTGFEESMQYGMPTYRRDGVSEVAWASQKQYIAVYVLRGDVLDAHRDQLTDLNVGKGCIRYRNAGQVDLAVIRSMLSAVAATHKPVC